MHFRLIALYLYFFLPAYGNYVIFLWPKYGNIGSYPPAYNESDTATALQSERRPYQSRVNGMANKIKERLNTIQTGHENKISFI